MYTEIFSSVHLTLLMMPFIITWIFRSNDPPLTEYTTHKTHKEKQMRKNDSQQISRYYYHALNAFSLSVLSIISALRGMN